MTYAKHALVLMMTAGLLSSCAGNPRAMKAATDVAYQYSPTAGLVMDGINLLTTVFTAVTPAEGPEGLPQLRHEHSGHQGLDLEGRTRRRRAG